MQTQDVEDAVCKVLPAVNLRPEGFKLDAGFLQRALRSEQPRALSLESNGRLFIYLGERSGQDPQAIVEGLASEALAVLTDYARQYCKHLVVGWNNPQGQVFAAAYTVAPDGKNGTLKGSSWTAPETWPEPMIDISKPADDAIHQALAQVQTLVQDQANGSVPSFDVQIERLLKLIDMQLLQSGGEGQRPNVLPTTAASWAEWLDAFTLSVLTEWARVGGGQGLAPVVPTPNPKGPLKGLLVFVSYRRTDFIPLAWPVCQALLSCGAEVWFDRLQLLEKSVIDIGLEAEIAKCDAYILCASDEFFEGSGYGTQEFAWAVRARSSGGKLQRVAVVAEPETILPNAVASWPAIMISDDTKELAHHLADALLQQTSTIIGPSPAAALPPTAVLSPLPLQADLPYLFRRVRHCQWFEEISEEDIVQLFAQGANDRQSQLVREKLLHLCDGSDWNGTLQDIDQWPEDSLIRDARLRFAGVRAVAGTHWPLNDDLNWKPGVAPDIEYLATRRVPILDWPAMVGWDDNERRFALRHHIGLLRILQNLLRRGLFRGLINVPTPTLDAWERELTERRRECYDAILALRLDDRLSWKNVPTWDGPFRAWRDILLYEASQWREPVPSQILQILVANATAIAAVAAELGWYVARRGGFATQAFPLEAFGTPTAIEVYTSALADHDDQPQPATENTVRVGLVAEARDRVELRLEWNTPRLSPSMPSGASSRAAPQALHRVVNALKA